ncbi:MAG: hypothetical protein KFH98_01780 [Gemmatimonadetes bacterium]|nr:hypothetical protein [Gemmatimonadota bacterium]
MLLAFALVGVPATASAGVPDDDHAVVEALRTRFYVGMWTSHVRDPARGLDGNAMVGGSYRGFFGATFVNSYGDRALAAGIQRGITQANRSVTTSLGYRVGLVTGYDERFLPIAAHTPLIPFAQIVGGLDHRRFGAELAYAGLTASVLLSVKP